MNVIPCTTWVKRGVAATNPEKIELKHDELEQIIERTHFVSDDETQNLDKNAILSETQSKIKLKKQCSTTKDDEYNFNDYDNESGDVYCHIDNIVSFDRNDKDLFMINDNDDSDKEDDIIKDDDNLLLIGHVDRDSNNLEVFVYNEREGSFYCHHDILLSSFPLCIEWLNYDPSDSKPGNLCAIGSMSPIIEVWDVDLIDCLQPIYKLGRKSSKKRGKQIGHKDAVLDIAWNPNYTHVLASGSVDQTVLLWDLDICKPVTKLDSFAEKVQALKWHPQETNQLLTGSADKLIQLIDCKNETIVRRWKISGEVERVLWNCYDTNYCIAATDNGYIEYFDIRIKKPIWQIKAHEKEVTGLSLSSSCQGLLVSSSNDGIMKVWDINDHKNPVLVWEKKTNLGALQCLAANPDNGFIFAVGGDEKQHNLKVLDLSEISEVREKFMDENHIQPHSSATQSAK